MLPESRKYLADMLEAAKSIGEFSAGKTLADFSGNKLLRGGIYYQFMIIGEALAQMRVNDSETAEKITDYSRIIGFRNQLIHGYGKLDDEITWRIIADKLPILLRELTSLLAE
jgi:uncharacterized protein with HEPN domain